MQEDITEKKKSREGKGYLCLYAVAGLQSSFSSASSGISGCGENASPPPGESCRRNCEFCISLRRYKVPFHLIERDSHHEEYHRKATTDAKKVVTARIHLACGAQLAIRIVTINCSENCSGNGQRKHVALESASFDNVDRKSVTDLTVRRVRFNWER